MTFGLSTRLRALRGGADALAARMRPHLPKVVAGLLAFGLACAQPAAVARPVTPTLIGSVSDAPSGAFLGSHEPGRAGVESSALALVTAMGGLPAGEHGLGPWVQAAGALVAADRCPPAALQVSWVPPVGDHHIGGYVAPLGPPPTEHTTRVNGVVVCRTSDYAFLGFEATWDGGRWRLSAVPALAADEEAPLLEGEAEAEGAAPAVDGANASGDAGPPALPQAAEWDGAALEPPAVYVPQTTCDPTAKPGVLGFRDLLLTTFPGSRNLGIGRVCEAEGVSEHKEGRAFDWGVAADDPGERAEAETVLAWLLSPDSHGEPFAMARRLGLMYVIWDGHIWSAFRAADGWRPYVGVSEHRDHIHFSFDWPGAMGQTSFWRGGSARAGSALPDLPLVPVAPKPAPLPFGALPPGVVLPPIPLPPGLVAPSSSSSGGEPPPSESPTTTSTTTTTTTTAPPPSTTTSTTAPPTTTTTTSPVLTFPSSPPTTLRVGSL